MTEEQSLSHQSTKSMAIGLAIHLLISIVAVAGHEWCRVNAFNGNWHAKYENVFFVIFMCCSIAQIIPLIFGAFAVAALRVFVALMKPPSPGAEVEMLTIIGMCQKSIFGIPGLSLLLSSIVFLWPALRSTQ